MRYDEERHAATSAVDHHQTLASPAPARHQLGVMAHRVQIGPGIGCAPIDFDVNDLAERSVQSPDSGSSAATEAECGHHAPSMSPSRAGQRDKPRMGAPWRTSRTVHDRRVAKTAASASGRCEKIGYSTSSPEVSSEAMYCGASGWKTTAGRPCGVLNDREVGRYAPLTDRRTTIHDRIARRSLSLWQ